MGQYYRGVILGKTTHKTKKIIVKQAFCCYAHNTLAKLMEHSYVGNWYVKEYEYALANEFFGYPFVWCGDYADNKYESQPYELACQFIHEKMLKKIKKAGYKYDESKYFSECKLYDLGGNVIDTKSGKHFRDVIPYEELKNCEYDFIINLDKKQYVRIPKHTNDNELVIHPLPLLCASGNQRNGGDYYGNDEIYVGSWAYDRIGIGFSEDIPENFTELVVNFQER